MEPYTFARDGDGWRFTPRKAHRGGLVMALFFPALILSIFTVGLTMVAWIAFAIWRAVQAGGSAYGREAPSFFVSEKEVVGPTGGRVPVSRISQVNIRNSYDQSYVSSGSTIGIVAPLGSGMAVAGAFANLGSELGAAARAKRAQTAYYLTVEFGGRQERLAAELDEVAARGLQNDVLLALQGQLAAV